MTLRWRVGFTVGYVAFLTLQGLCMWAAANTDQPWLIPFIALTTGATIRDLYRLWKPRKDRP
jgi:hypothetical protein